MEQSTFESTASLIHRSPVRHLRRLGWFLLIAIPILVVSWFFSPILGPYPVHIHPSSVACLNNMRNISLGIAEAAALKKGGLPAYTVDADGNKLHSWRTLILPFVEEQTLYSKIRLDEPWDSEYNRQFHDVAPIIYCCRNNYYEERDKSVTNSLLVTGPGSLFDGAKPVHGDDFPLKTETTKTLLLVETSQSVHWMCPEDISHTDYDAEIVSPHGKVRNIIYTNLQAERLGHEPFLSFFSATEILFGYYLPITLFGLIVVVTVIQVFRFLWELRTAVGLVE